MLDLAIQKHIDSTVLCWLATVGADGYPNVSPKELFTYDKMGNILIANIASPQSVRNIQSKSQVCVSWVDIFTQKGYKAKGRASIIKVSDKVFEQKAQRLKEMAGDAFPINMLIEIEIESIEEIIAPRYRFYPNTTEEEQIADAMKSYKVKALIARS